MILLGAIANSAAVFAGGAIGIILKNGISERYGNLIMNGLGLFTLAIGTSFFLKSENIMIVVLSIVTGCILGELLNIDKKLESIGNSVHERSKETSTDKFSEGFVTATLMFCVGSMAIMGSLQSGLLNNHEILYTKSVMDGITALILGSTFGLGVLLSAFPLFIYQGSIVLLASLISPFLSSSVINEMTAVGGILLIGLALVVLGIKKIKVANMLPSLLIPIIIMIFVK